MMQLKRNGAGRLLLASCDRAGTNGTILPDVRLVSPVQQFEPGPFQRFSPFPPRGQRHDCCAGVTFSGGKL